MFENVLIAVDGSEHSLKAAKLAGGIARNMGSDLWVVIAYDPVPGYLGEPYLQRAISERMDHAEKLFEEAKQEIGSITGELHTEILEDDPAEAIITVAETRNVDLIVMGTRGLGKIKGMLQGSQSQKVVVHAVCPVLLVK